MNSSLPFVPDFFEIYRSIDRDLAGHEIAAIFFGSEIVAKIDKRGWIVKFARANKWIIFIDFILYQESVARLNRQMKEKEEQVKKKSEEIKGLRNVFDFQN